MDSNAARITIRLIAMIALLAVVSSGTVLALSNLGGRCDSSKDCREGYCLNLTCQFPSVMEKFETLGNCSYTAECADGFCKDGVCVSPLVEEHEIFTLGGGVESSCAGLIENCTGIWCMFCNMTWVLLAVGAVAAAFVSRRKGRILPVLMLFLPLMTGIIVFPIAGFIFSALEVFIVAFINKPVIQSGGFSSSRIPPSPPIQRPPPPLPFDEPSEPPPVSPPASPPSSEA